MFSAPRESLLDSDKVKWLDGETKKPGLRIFDSWRLEAQSHDPSKPKSSISSSELNDWLAQRNKFSNNDTLARSGVMRVLFCKRKHYKPIDFPLSKESYLNVESSFNLPKATFQSLCNNGGLFSAHISYQSPNAPSSTNEAQSPTPNRIGILVKAWQNSAVANYGLSLSYDIKSKTTCALLHGNDVYDPKSYDHLCKLIKISISSWGGHPMLLPTILYGDHISRMHPVAAEYEDSVIRIEGQLGVARSGRNRGNHVPQRVANVREQSMHMYTVLTNLLFLLHCSNWQRRYADFLLENLDPESKESLSSYLDDDQALVTLQLRQEVKHMASESESIESLLKQLRSRLEKQLDVLNNQLNAKMAASAVRDSTSMRILAAIAGLFLPGTFIATLFSMSMFDWQGSGDASASSSGMISKYFWVYWVVAIPLTLLVMLAWRSWWVYSNSHFDKDIRAFMEDVEKNAEHDRGGSSKVKNHLKKAKEEEAADM